jgi:hypothetical protein
MKTYEIQASGKEARIMELSSDGREVLIGDFPSSVHAQTWIDTRLGGLLRSVPSKGMSLSTSKPPERE